MHATARSLIVSFAAALAAGGGCEGKDPLGRLPLSGTVTFQGRPLDQGSIEFLPPDLGKGFSARAMIRDGTYRIPREQGLPPGTYRVLITSAEPSKGEAPDGPPGLKLPPPGQERIPAEYNRASRETVEVKAGAPNQFDFTIK